MCPRVGDTESFPPADRVEHRFSGAVLSGLCSPALAAEVEFVTSGAKARFQKHSIACTPEGVLHPADGEETYG
jgi:hypothetical protein